jgi:hypothetical protein
VAATGTAVAATGTAVAATGTAVAATGMAVVDMVEIGMAGADMEEDIVVKIYSRHSSFMHENYPINREEWKI